MLTKYIATPFVKGRYIRLQEVEKMIELLPKSLFFIREIGQSVQGKSLYKIQFGAGKTRVILWSQMHGNEGTTTKGLMDWLYALLHDVNYYRFISENYSICILPMVNPDGANMHTRVNASNIDLNRDAKIISQPESQLLRKAIEDFQPDFALNLHDQRTIFGVGESDTPSTMAFLAPAFNEERTINGVRQKAMAVIVAIYEQLSKQIGQRIARFDDGFNDNCIGDYLTLKSIPTILFEAGHYPNDYQRELTRVCVFQSIVYAFAYMYNLEDLSDDIVEKYRMIPNNLKTFNDIKIEGYSYCEPSLLKNGHLMIQFVEQLKAEQIDFVPTIDRDETNHSMHAHLTIMAKNYSFFNENDVYQFLKQTL
ncbi:M14 family zinc carboxypeptidase [Capnocytophaga sp. ARDL2]|uniref:M14 family zinc carboxypeptidase n=1 Tax=Capnocytophaga sp. ARDL2 TaxID=3238809 RepID=UPI0035575040